LGLFALLTASLVALPAAHAGLTGSPQVVAGGLNTPWEVVAMPDGRLLVTERPGRVRVIEANGSLRVSPAHTGDADVSKFLGLALHPNYAVNRFVYLYVSYGADDKPNANRVIRLVDDGTNLVSPVTVFQGGSRATATTTAAGSSSVPTASSTCRSARRATSASRASATPSSSA